MFSESIPTHCTITYHHAHSTPTLVSPPHCIIQHSFASCILVAIVPSRSFFSSCHHFLGSDHLWVLSEFDPLSTSFWILGQPFGLGSPWIFCGTVFWLYYLALSSWRSLFRTIRPVSYCPLLVVWYRFGHLPVSRTFHPYLRLRLVASLQAHRHLQNLAVPICPYLPTTTNQLHPHIHILPSHIQSVSGVSCTYLVCFRNLLIILPYARIFLLYLIFRSGIFRFTHVLE